jgi:hypothetical protein
MQMTREDARSHVLEEPVGDGILEKELREFVQAEDPGSYDDKIKLPKTEADVFLGGDGPILWGGPVVIKANEGRIWKIFRTDSEQGFLRDEQFLFLYNHSQWVAAWAPPSMALMQQGHGCTRGFSQLR